MFNKRTECPSCEATDSDVVFETPYAHPDLRAYLGRYYSQADSSRQAHFLEGGDYVIRRCGSCGLLFQQDVPDDDFMAELYGHWLGRNDPLAPHQPQMPLEHYTYLMQEALQLVAFLRHREPDRKRLKMLDYGAGWGHWAQLARSMGCDVVVAEVSPAKVAHLSGLGFRVASLDELEPASFDFISTEQVVEHLSQPRQVVGRLRQLLRPNGVLKLSVPDAGKTAEGLSHWHWADGDAHREQIMPLQPLEHLNGFSAASLDRFASQFGLDRVGIPLATAYAYPCDWSSAAAVARSVARPLKRFVFKRGCYGLYAQPS